MDCITSKAKSNRWDEQKTERLIELWKARITSTAIAKELQISRSAVMGKVTRLGLIGRGPPQQLPPNGRKSMPAVLEETVSREAPPKIIAPQPIRLRSDGLPYAKPRDLPLPSDAARRSFNDISGPCYSLADLSSNCCHWPLGDPRDHEFFCYCGATTWNSPYCPQHLRVMYPNR